MAPIGIGVVGLGRAFTLMLPAFQGDRRIELAAGFDPRPAACTQFERDFSAPAYASVEQLARDPGVEVVYIASPHQFHAEHACVAAAAGKHVLVEKPMALSLAECDAMIETCAANGVHLIVGHCHSFDAPYLCTRKLVQSGAFGAVRMVHALNYTDFLYRPRRPEELDTAHGGGAVYNQAAHQVDIVRLVAGGRVTRVMAATGRWDAGRPTEGAYSAMMWFDHGAFASITYSGYAHFDSDEWMDWVGEMGHVKDPSIYGAARRRHSTATSPQEESRWKNQS
ncbi:MAG TPA: Gfo/Idh/MocA family oxidoreductase, partial [Rubrivivax sp.]|nr:Gfo/Idh/MocA family oxidoreductase [Rubrivivax sp.]